MAAVTIYWYGPERPASRQCLARCAARLPESRWRGLRNAGQCRKAKKESPFFRFPPKPIVLSLIAGIIGSALFPASRSALICRFTSRAVWRRCPAVFSIRRRTGICRLSDFRIFTGSGRQRRALSNFPAKGSAEISAGFPLRDRRGFCPGSMACSFGLCHFAVIIRYAFARKRFHRFNWCRENKHGS